MARRTAAGLLRLDVRELARAGALRQGCEASVRWGEGEDERGGVHVEAGAEEVRLRYHANGRPVSCPVRLDWTPCTYGGRRPWVRCPSCSRRVALLYGGARELFLCRRCLGLCYSTQLEHRFDRLLRRADAIRRRLGIKPREPVTYADKPKGMHWATFERLKGQVEAADAAILARLKLHLRRLGFSGL